jgi:arylsulfatase A-like enzyme
MNVLYLHCHDAGRYIQPYGYAIPTPNLQRLANEGTLFRQAFCAGPTCSPSRAALVTGMAPHSAGMFGLAHRPFAWKLNDYGQHIVQTLKSNGFHTALCGVQHVANFEDKAAHEVIGYHEGIEIDVRDEDGPGHAAGDRARARAAAQWLHGRQDNGQPFFLSVGFVLPHRVFIPAEPGRFQSEDARFIRPPVPVPDTPATRADMAEYIACARVMDECCGTVLDALADAGLADDTLVIATTDHGIAFPGMKCNLTDHGMGIYLVMRGPGGFNTGEAVDALVSHIDVFPTICDVLGIAPPEWLQGTSLLPLVRGEIEKVHDEVFAEVTYHAAYEPQRCIRTQRWKYIKRFNPDWTTPVLPNCDASVSKDLMLERGWGDREIAPVQLYDLVYDPNEACNLADRPQHVHTIRNLDARLTAWMERTGDPLRDGPVELGPENGMWPIDIVNIGDEGTQAGRVQYREQ